MNPQLQAIMARVAAIHQRIEWIAQEEARSALVGGKAAQGYFTEEKLKLIARTDELLDEAEVLLKRV